MIIWYYACAGVLCDNNSPVILHSLQSRQPLPGNGFLRMSVTYLPLSPWGAPTFILSVQISFHLKDKGTRKTSRVTTGTFRPYYAKLVESTDAQNEHENWLILSRRNGCVDYELLFYRYAGYIPHWFQCWILISLSKHLWAILSIAATPQQTVIAGSAELHGVDFKIQNAFFLVPHGACSLEFSSRVNAYYVYCIE